MQYFKLMYRPYPNIINDPTDVLYSGPGSNPESHLHFIIMPS